MPGSTVIAVFLAQKVAGHHFSYAAGARTGGNAIPVEGVQILIVGYALVFQGFKQGDGAGLIRASGTGAAIDEVIGIVTENAELGIFLQREKAIVIFQQNEALFADFRGQGVACLPGGVSLGTGVGILLAAQNPKKRGEHRGKGIAHNGKHQHHSRPDADGAGAVQAVLVGLVGLLLKLALLLFQVNE